jgi:hypothetical protein
MSSIPNHIIPSVCGLTAGASAYSILPRGMFDAYDTVFRVIIVGAVAGIVTLLGAILSQKRNSKP